MDQTDGQGQGEITALGLVEQASREASANGMQLHLRDGALRQHCPWAVAGEVADLHENDRGLAQSWFHRTWRLAGKRSGYAAGGYCLTPVGEYRPRRLGAPLRGDDENRETDQAVPQERIEPWRHSDPLR